MSSRTEVLSAELDAIILWDRVYIDNAAPDSIEKDACIARIFRRVQVVFELNRLAAVSEDVLPTYSSYRNIGGESRRVWSTKLQSCS
jgi:hypothetical protein